MTSRRKLLSSCAALAAAVALPTSAQPSPTVASDKSASAEQNPITILVPFPPGGRSGWLAQLMALGLHSVLGEAVTVVHRTGDLMKQAADFAGSAPDGRTLLIGMIRLPRRGVFSSDPENAVLNSLVPITVVAREPMVLVMAEQRATELAIATVADLLRHARRNPGMLTIASGANDNTDEQASELFKTMSRTYITRFAGAGLRADVEAVLDGRIDLMFASLHMARRSIRRRELRALAVTSGSQFPSPSLNQLGTFRPVPMLQSIAPFQGFEVYDYTGLYAPTGTPDDLADRLQQACAKVLADTSLRQLLLENNALPDGLSRADFVQLELTEERRWRQARGRW